MRVISTGSANSGGIVLAHVVVIPSSLLSPAIDRTIYLHLPPLLTHDACHVLHKCHRCVTASSSNLYWYLVKCAMRLSSVFQKKLYVRRIVRNSRGLRDPLSRSRARRGRGTSTGESAGGRGRKPVVPRVDEGKVGGEKGRTARCEVIWGVVESSRQCCVF